MIGAFRSGLLVKVAAGCKVRESKCKAQVEVSNGLM